MGIKLILLVGLLGCFFLYLKFFRSLLLDRIIAISFVLIVGFFVLVPDFTTSIAQLLGVGRGTDLVFYLFALGTAFAIILLYSKITSMLITQTELIRHLAIQQAEIESRVMKESLVDPT